MYRKTKDRNGEIYFEFNGDLERYLLKNGVPKFYIDLAKSKILRCYNSDLCETINFEKQIIMVPLCKVIGTCRGTIGQSVYDNVRRMKSGDREPYRFERCFSYFEKMSYHELIKSYETNAGLVDMCYIVNMDEYYLVNDGNHRTLTAMLIGAPYIRANVYNVELNLEKYRKYNAEQEFYKKYHIERIISDYNSVIIIFNKEYFGYDIKISRLPCETEGCYEIIDQLSKEVEVGKKFAKIIGILPLFLQNYFLNFNLRIMNKNQMFLLRQDFRHYTNVRKFAKYRMNSYNIYCNNIKLYNY